MDPTHGPDSWTRLVVPYWTCGLPRLGGVHLMDRPRVELKKQGVVPDWTPMGGVPIGPKYVAQFFDTMLLSAHIKRISVSHI